MLSRRAFLRASPLVALAPTVPCFLAQTARAAGASRDGRILVVIQLDGGNDGINSVVPFADPGYAQHRKVLRLARGSLVKVNEEVGLHPALADAGKLLDRGQLAIVQGVGYPNPSRSHLHSMAVWQSASLDRDDHLGPGWIGRGLDAGVRVGPGVPAAVFVGGGALPAALRSRRSVASALTRPEDFVLAPAVKPALGGAGAGGKEDLLAFLRRTAVDAGATAARMVEVSRARDGGRPYPATRLAGQLRLMARLIEADAGTRVFYARQPGYDTHAAQAVVHAVLLREFAGAVRAFLDDLARAKLAERVLVLAFSEFGRTVKENGSAGTDHGTAGPVFLAGPEVKAGLAGKTPSLTDLDPRDGDLKTAIDFRRVYATVLEGWLGLPGKVVLGRPFEKLPVLSG
jgi:uncharacterized protein (DUF1501 family)